MTIEEILAGESKNVEFKVQRPKDSVKYMKTVVAFSNGEGGRIVFGVDDVTREVVGIPKDIVFSESFGSLFFYCKRVTSCNSLCGNMRDPFLSSRLILKHMAILVLLSENTIFVSVEYVF